MRIEIEKWVDRREDNGQGNKGTGYTNKEYSNRNIEKNRRKEREIVGRG